MKNINNRIIKVTILLSLISSILISCSIDDLNPKHKLKQENLVTDVKSAELVLNGVYANFRGVSYAKFAAALTLAGVEHTGYGDIYGADGFRINTVDPQVARITLNIYTEWYKTINLANNLIEQLEAGKAVSLSKIRREQIIAEAKTMRAFSYFMLLRTFGQFYDINSKYGVPVYKKAFKEKIARNNVKEVYELIIDDLNFAIENAPIGKEHFYVSPTFAKALLAKVYLSKNDFTNAAKTALEVINDNTDSYELQQGFYNEIFEQQWGKEILFAPYYLGVNEGFLDNYITPANLNTPTDFFKNIISKQVNAEPDLENYTYGVDPRASLAYYNLYDYRENYGKYTYSDPTTETDKSNTMYYLRMAEVYLIYAEAETRRQGGDPLKALEKLNEVRERVKVKIVMVDPYDPTIKIEEVLPTKLLPKIYSDQKTLLMDIFEEKMLELNVETGEPWYDLVRYDRLGTFKASDIKSTITNANKLIFPLHIDVILGGEGLIEQNPGY